MKKNSIPPKIEEDVSLDNMKSYIKKDEGKYYIRVEHLFKKEYKEEKRVFNIRLKV